MSELTQKQIEQFQSFGRFAGHVYLGLVESKVPPLVAVAILVQWMREVGKQSPADVIAETLKRVEENS